VVGMLDVAVRVGVCGDGGHSIDLAAIGGNSIDLSLIICHLKLVISEMANDKLQICNDK
jgi:hypothetical protein